MNSILYIIQVLWRKRWWLFGIPVLASVFVYINLHNSQKQYKSTTTMYTGIISGYDMTSGSASANWMITSNALANLMNLVKAESTLEKVFLKLYARNLVNLDTTKDNDCLTVESSIALIEECPNEIRSLVVEGDEDATYERISDYYYKNRGNYLQHLFHSESKYYSYLHLSEVEIERIGDSDMISISYVNSDKYIVYNTLKILVECFISQYVSLRYEQTDNVVEYLQAELNRIRGELDAKEAALTNYYVHNSIINYEEQTKAVVVRSSDVETALEEVNRAVHGASEKLSILEKKMESATELFKSNTEFLNKLHSISELYKEDTQELDDGKKIKLAQRISKETKDLRDISSRIALAKYSKEGLSISNMTEEWLNCVLTCAKGYAELEILTDSKRKLDKEVERYSPVGSSIKSQEREISFTEQSYLSNLQALNEAILRKKNLQLTSATFKTLTPPTVALHPEKTKNVLFTIITFILVFAFLAIIAIVQELINKKPYDKKTAERLTGLRVIGAYPMLSGGMYDNTWAEFAANQLVNAMVNQFDRTKTNNIINIISLNREEGKSTIAKKLYGYFEKLDIKPFYASWHEDFDFESKYYLMAGSIYDFIVNEANLDGMSENNVTIVEYPPIATASFPTKLLATASINLVVVDSERDWTEMDQILVKQLFGNTELKNVFLCLNGADIDTVGTFTGILPPYSLRHRLNFTMLNLGN